MSRRIRRFDARPDSRYDDREFARRPARAEAPYARVTQTGEPPIGGTFGLELRRFLRANGSSIGASLLEWVLITVLVGLNVHYLYAATVGAVLGAIMDFAIKRHWAFERGTIGAVHSEGLRYLAASALSLVWNLAVAYTLVDGLHMAKVPGVIASSIIVGIAWNYPVHRYFVFHDRPASA